MSNDAPTTTPNYQRDATSKDVAELAGVSRATVSAVLSGRKGTIRTSEQTRIRVLDAAKQLGYSPNLVAQALRRRRSGTIAYVPRRRNANPGYYHLTYQLSLYVARVTARYSRHLLEVSPEVIVDEDNADLIDFLLSRRPEGVIFDAPDCADDVRRVVEQGIPVVQLLRPLSEVPTPTVTVDPAHGVSTAIHHLASLGHRSIAYLGNGDPHDVELRRIDAFKAALVELGLPVRPESIILGNQYSIDEGQLLMERLLSQSSWPTAVFAASDVLTMGALRALYAANIRVPDQMSFISFDDTHASMLYPPVSAVGQPLEELIEAAVSLLVGPSASHSSQADKHSHIDLETTFCNRESTAPPPGEPARPGSHTG